MRPSTDAGLAGRAPPPGDRRSPGSGLAPPSPTPRSTPATPSPSTPGSGPRRRSPGTRRPGSGPSPPTPRCMAAGADPATFCSSRGILVEEIGVDYPSPPDDDAHRPAGPHPLPPAGPARLQADDRPGPGGRRCAPQAAALIEAIEPERGHRRRARARRPVPPPGDLPACWASTPTSGPASTSGPRRPSPAPPTGPRSGKPGPPWPRCGRTCWRWPRQRRADPARRRGLGAGHRHPRRRRTHRRRAGHVPDPAPGGRERDHPQPALGRPGGPGRAPRRVGARLRADRSLVPTAVEELLRWTTPVISFLRTATRDTELRGQAIAAGRAGPLVYASANRDEEVFGPTADRLDVGRDPNPHVSFGFGPHFCLGAAAGPAGGPGGARGAARPVRRRRAGRRRGAGARAR